MSCASLLVSLSLQCYCSPSSKGKNSAYFTFLAQAFWFLRHLGLSQQLSTCNFLKVKISCKLQPPPLREHGADVNIFVVIHPLPKRTHDWGSRMVAVKSTKANKQRQHQVNVFAEPSGTETGEGSTEVSQVQLSLMGNLWMNLVGVGW